MELWLVVPLYPSLVAFSLCFLLHSLGDSKLNFNMYDSKDRELIISMACKFIIVGFVKGNVDCVQRRSNRVSRAVGVCLATENVCYQGRNLESQPSCERPIHVFCLCSICSRLDVEIEAWCNCKVDEQCYPGIELGPVVCISYPI